MEATRRFFLSKIQKPGKDDDSSDEEKKTDKAGKNAKNLRPPKLSSKWPPHLKELHGKFSATHPAPALDAAIELLHALQLDAAACTDLRRSGVISDVLKELEGGHMHFGEVLTGRPSFLIPLFTFLVSPKNIQAAKRLVQLCDPGVMPMLIHTEAYDYMQALLQTEGKEAKGAKREKELFIANVERKIKGGADVCATQLEPLIRGCPASAQKSVLKLLESKVVKEACVQSSELADAIEKLRMPPAAWSKAKVRLPNLVERINSAMSAAALGDHSTGLQLLAHDEVSTLFGEVDMGLSQKDFDLQTLIAMLCPGKYTTQLQAKFVAGLMGRLIQGAHAREEPFDFRGFLSAALHSGMPGLCAKWIAGPAVQALRSAEEAEQFVTALEQMIYDDAGMGTPQLTALQQLVSIVSSDIAAAKHLEADLSRTNSLGALQKRLEEAKENSIKRIVELSAASNAPGELENDMARDREAAQKLSAKLEKERTKLRQEQKEAVLASLSADALAALKALRLDWDEKLKFAAAMSQKLQKSPLSIQEVVAELVNVGTEDAAEVLGVLAAMLLADGKSDLSDEMLIATLGKSDLPYKVAIGLVGTWYATQTRAGQPTLDATTDLCKALSRLKDVDINWSQLSALYLQCQISMRQWAFFGKKEHEFTENDKKVRETIQRLR